MGANKQNIKDIRSEINDALSSIGRKYGINFSIGTIRYNSFEMRCKLTGRNQGQVNLLNSTITRPTISLSDLVGKRFKVKKTIYTVLSTNDKPKFNVVARTHRGIVYNTTLEFLQSGAELR